MAGEFSSFPNVSLPRTESAVFRDIEAVFPSAAQHGWRSTRVATARVGRETRGGDFHVAVCGLAEQAVFCVGTVEGGGVFESLAKSTLCGTIRAVAPEARSPLTIIRALDEVLRHFNSDLGRERVTCSLFCAILDRYEETLTVACLGSVVPVVHGEAGSHVVLEPSGPALGISDNLLVSAHTLSATQVRRLVIGTASVTATTEGRSAEACPPFGAERLRTWVCDTCALSAEDQAEVLAKAVGDFLGAGHEPHHETDVVVIELFGEDKPHFALGVRDRLFGRFPEGMTVEPDPSIYLG